MTRISLPPIVQGELFLGGLKTDNPSAGGFLPTASLGIEVSWDPLLHLLNGQPRIIPPLTPSPHMLKKPRLIIKVHNSCSVTSLGMALDQ